MFLLSLAGVVIAHPIDPGLAGRIAALKASIPKSDLDGLVAKACTMTPEAVLAMVAEWTRRPRPRAPALSRDGIDGGRSAA